MLNIQLILKRLNKLWLPEYEELRKFIYEPNKLNESLVKNTIYYYSNKDYKTSLNVQKAQAELNWKPRLNLKSTINLTINWYKNYFKEKNKNIELYSNEQIQYFLDN